MTTPPDEFYEWLELGIARGWVSRPVCDTHDVLPCTEDELEEFDAGFDPCIPAMRVYGPTPQSMERHA